MAESKISLSFDFGARRKEKEAIDRGSKIGKILSQSEDPAQQRIGAALEAGEIRLEDLSGQVGKAILGTKSPLEELTRNLEIGAGGELRIRQPSRIDAAIAEPMAQPSRIDGAITPQPQLADLTGQVAEPTEFRTTKRTLKLGGITETQEKIPTKTEEQKELEKKITEKELTIRATKIAEANIKREILSKDLEAFFAVDDLIDRGEGFGRITAGIKTIFRGFEQRDIKGFAAATHNAMRKRLRVQLVRAAGDVGNLNIVEQQAAELMIPVFLDAQGTADFKRANLEQLSKAIDDKSENEVKRIINSFILEGKRKGIKGLENFPIETEQSPEIDLDNIFEGL